MVVHLLHHNGLLPQLTVSQEENLRLATSKSGTYFRSGGASSEKSERSGEDFDVIFQSEVIPN